MADLNAVEELAGMIADSENPLILTSALGQNPTAVPALEKGGRTICHTGHPAYAA